MHRRNPSCIVYVIAVISQIYFELLCARDFNYASPRVPQLPLVPQVALVTDDFSRTEKKRKHLLTITRSKA